MRVTPVRRVSAPGYPTRAILDAHPELLRLVPKRWRGNPVVLTALAAVCALLTVNRSASADAAKAPASLVAPVFVHGEGRGGAGCIVINPPVFLSEAEARQVIQEEAKKAGLSFAPNGPQVEDVNGPLTDRWAHYVVRLHPTGRDKTPRQAPRWRRNIKLDGVDKRRAIAYEFVSTEDFDDWHRGDRSGPTVYHYDIAGAALVLREGLAAKRPRGVCAVFYDPVTYESGPLVAGTARGAKSASTDWRAVRVERRKRARVISAKELRAQVRDFIAWLKAQGVI